MKIISELLKDDLSNGRPIKLDLGSGKGGSNKKGFYSLDHIDMEGIDIVADLNKPLDLLPDNSVEYLYSRHTLEHVDNLLSLMREIYRITTRNAVVEIIVPHYTNPYFYSDPTHKNFFGLYSMYYFVDPDDQPFARKVPAFYSDVRFDIDKIRIKFYQLTKFDKWASGYVYKMVNKSITRQDFYERRISPFFHAWEIHYLMKTKK